MIKIVSLLSIIASACAGGLNHLIPSSPAVATLGAPAFLSSNYAVPSVLSVAGLAHQHVTVARPSAVAVERVSVGSIPSVSVVNEPTTIVTEGRPVRGHSFTSEVRHDSVARLAAPIVSYGYPAYTTLQSGPIVAPALTRTVVETPEVAKVVAEPIVQSPEVSEVVETKTLSAPLPAIAAPLPAYRTVVSAPQVLATGPASVVAGPVSVKGYTREVGRTELVNEVRLRAASIPATIVQDHVVESVPTLYGHYGHPYLTNTVLSSPLLSTLIKK